jgi:hypothetical protein
MIMRCDLQCALPSINGSRAVPALLVLSSDTTDELREEIMDDIEFVSWRKINRYGVANKKINAVLYILDDGIDCKNEHIYIGKIKNPNHVRAKLLHASRHAESVLRLFQLTGTKRCNVIDTLYNLVSRYDRINSALWHFNRIFPEVKHCVPTMALRRRMLIPNACCARLRGTAWRKNSRRELRTSRA